MSYNILVYRLVDDTMTVCIFCPITSFTDIQRFTEMFDNKYQQILKHYFQDGLTEKTLTLNNVSIYYYQFKIKSTHDDFWTFRLSCPPNEVDKLLQLFKDERIKLEIQKEIFEEI